MHGCILIPNVAEPRDTMKQAIKKKWLKALRSGEYEQGIGELREDETHYCCLGVLGDILGIKWGKEYKLGKAEHLGVLPRYYACGLSDYTQENLASRNDGRNGLHKHSFSEIADYIEANL